jgi:hypothetical protein
MKNSLDSGVITHSLLHEYPVDCAYTWILLTLSHHLSIGVYWMKRLVALPFVFLIVVVMLFTTVSRAQAVVVPVVPAPTQEKAPDDRINWKHGDGYAVLYPRQDDQGNPVLHIYCIVEKGNGSLGYVLSRDLFSQATAKPSKNTQVGETDACRVPIKFYVLTTGEYQINIGPNAEGKVDVIVFTGLPPMNVHYYHWK